MAGESLLRLFADLGASLNVIPHRLVKRFSQTFHRIRMKTHAVTNTGNPAGEDAVIVVIPDAVRIALVAYGIGHGVTPKIRFILAGHRLPLANNVT